MRIVISVLVLSALISLQTGAQPVSNYIYKLDNGIAVKTEHAWSQVWVQQVYSDMAAGDKSIPLAVNIRALGSLISASEYKLLNGEKEVKLQGATPGNYDLRLTFKLSGKPGSLSFVVGNIIIKPKTKTAISVILYDYQVMIDETAASLAGNSSYESDLDRCKSHTIQDIYYGIPSFFEKGNHEKQVTPAKTESKIKGELKSGTYDVLLSIAISNQTHKVWLENFTFKPDVKYKITINLNAGGIQYTGTSKEVDGLHLYPAGTAAKQTGTPAPLKNLETISYDKATIANCTSPGTYDVLLRYSNGKKYEWRKNIAVSTGSKTEVK